MIEYVDPQMFVRNAAYHEAGHVTAAVLQDMRLRERGVHVDLPFLPKPFDGETLKARVRAILASPAEPAVGLVRPQTPSRLSVE